ncbi:hypothetical protein BC777_0751 [Yoonia maricola]|uniref:Uncharacterized protein n=1 Tax=Yoonia maricola TaxID=420999 RepID=A0A2M8WLV6_9RHOB|nr:hypothetical protein [Yoonia maricola]PJI91910.1 hypothetical protein BC777_0751 [Yoonia maricola]
MKFLLTVLFGAILGSAATFYYIYVNHADGTEQALMRDTLLTYAPFLEEYITP